MNRPRQSFFRAWLGALGALLACACLPMGDRVAGSSTEAGNAGGKLSLSDGQPAADVSVALVARSYLPDTLAGGGLSGAGADKAGAYYRTRTQADGSFSFTGVAPGVYRVMAVGQGTGVMADSIAVGAGLDTLLDAVLKPLGGIRGVAKLVGSEEKVNLWVRPKATLKDPPRADPAAGSFRLDSLPEGEYELVPQCFTCKPVKEGYRVHVKAGQDTTLADTLKVYPEYFYGFPDSGDLEVRSAWLPLRIHGKVNRGADRNGIPGSILWDWNGTPLTGNSVQLPDGISETGTVLDSSLFAGAGEGTLRVTLAFPDTLIIRTWHVILDSRNRIWPLSAVRVDSAWLISGALQHTWRFRLAETRPLEYADVAYWGIKPLAEANQSAWPDSLELAVEDSVAAAMLKGDPSHMTFILVPDAKLGGRLLRPRWDERLSDFGEIHYLEKARFGFTDTLEPSMLPGGLIVDRHRGAHILQRYRVDSTGAVEALLGALPLGIPAGEALLLFYRVGDAAKGYAWDKPLRDAGKALAVTRAGLAMRLDSTGISVQLTAGELALLKELLGPLAGDSAPADTEAVQAKGDLEYLWSGNRGLLHSAGEAGAGADRISALRAWMARNGLEEPARFPLAGAAWKYLGFAKDTSGLRYTGDTLIVELEPAGDSATVREFFSAGSPGRARDSAVIEYGLKIARDSLVLYAVSGATASRLFGTVTAGAAVFALTGLAPVSPAVEDGIPVLTGNGNTLSGRLAVPVDLHGGPAAGVGVWLDGRGILARRTGLGFLYTPEGGLERAWRFSGGDGSVKGWDKL